MNPPIELHNMNDLILIVDDEPINIDLLERRLKRTGFQTITASSGKEALEVIEKHSIDLVLLDLMMPDMDGYEVLQMLRRRFQSFELPIIMVTADNNRDAQLRCLEMGANDFINKPVDYKILLARTTSQLKLKQAEERSRLLWEQAESLVDFSHKINQTLNLDELITILKNTLPTKLQVGLFSLFLKDQQNPRQLKLITHNHTEWEGEGEVICPDSTHNIMWDAIAANRTLIVENYSTSKYHRSGLMNKYETDNAICIPLEVRGQVLGVLNLNNLIEPIIQPEYMSNIERMASHLSMSINNILLHEEIELLATTDALTQCYNRRYFYRELNKELKRISRYKKVGALLYMDIDHFKAVNDTHGHPIGDLALQMVGLLLQNSFRKTDVSCRFGGEEFVVMLLETAGESAYVLAERLRTKVEEMAIPLSNNESFSVTLSIGVTELTPEDTLEQAIRRADQGLYQAKHSGRNRCVLL